MTFRARLLLVIMVTVALSVGLVAWQVSSNLGSAFERMDRDRSAALVSQFRQEFASRGSDVKQKIDTLAGSDFMVRMSIELSRPNADPSAYVNSAQDLATQN